MEVIQKPIMGWIKEVLQDPYLSSYIHWYLEKVFICDNNGRWMWHVDEPWTADDLWDMWVSIFPLGVYIYANKSKLSSFGSVAGYLVIARLANLPHSICNTTGTGGGCLIGWLPDIRFI